MNPVRTLLDKLASVFLKIQALPRYRSAARRLRPAVRVVSASAEEARCAVQGIFQGDADYRPGPQVTPFVAYHGARPVGFVELVRRDLLAREVPGYWLFSLYVRNRYRGAGIGEDLCQAVIAAARQEGADSLTLFVAPDNAPAQALYRKLGFAVITDPREIEQLQPERDACPPVVMRKALA